MPTDKRPLELDDIYKTPIGDLFVLSDQELGTLISDAEEVIRKCGLIKQWLNGAKHLKAARQPSKKIVGLVMNPFQKHGIEHLSASSLNLARDNLPLWIIRYLGKVKGQQSVNMLAGIAVEEAVARGLDHPDIDEEAIIQFAKDEYLKKTALGFDQEDRENKLQEITGRPAEGRKQAWDGMVRNALRTLRPYGIPTKPETGKQHRIEVFLDGIHVPLIGFKDFSFDQHGLDIDLKTTARMPTDMSFDHQLQGAVYWKASGNRAQRFAYVTKAKADVLELTPEAAAYAIHTATGIAHCLQRFLSLSSDWQELSQLTIPDYSNFRWDSLTAGAARELWGF